MTFPTLVLPSLLALFGGFTYFFIQNTKRFYLAGLSFETTSSRLVRLLAYTVIEGVFAFALSPILSADPSRDVLGSTKHPPLPFERERWVKASWRCDWAKFMREYGGHAMYFFETEEDRDEFEAAQRRKRRTETTPPKKKLGKGIIGITRSRSVDGLLMGGFRDSFTGIRDLFWDVHDNMMPTTRIHFFCMETAMMLINLSCQAYIERGPEDTVLSSLVPTTEEDAISTSDMNVSSSSPHNKRQSPSSNSLKSPQHNLYTPPFGNIPGFGTSYHNDDDDEEAHTASLYSEEEHHLLSSNWQLSSSTHQLIHGDEPIQSNTSLLPLLLPHMEPTTTLSLTPDRNNQRKGDSVHSALPIHPHPNQQPSNTSTPEESPKDNNNKASSALITSNFEGCNASTTQQQQHGSSTTGITLGGTNSINNSSSGDQPSQIFFNRSFSQPPTRTQLSPRPPPLRINTLSPQKQQQPPITSRIKNLVSPKMGNTQKRNNKFERHDTAYELGQDSVAARMLNCIPFLPNRDDRENHSDDEVPTRRPSTELQSPTSSAMSMTDKNYGWQLVACVQKDGLQGMVVYCPWRNRTNKGMPAVGVVFRGTANLQNIKADVNILRVPISVDLQLLDDNDCCSCACVHALTFTARKIRVHSGFYTSYMLLRDDITAAVKTALQLLKEEEEEHYCNQNTTSPTSDRDDDRHEEVDDNGVPYTAQLLVSGHSLGGALATLACIDFYKTLHMRCRCYTFGSPRVGNRHFRNYFNSIVPDTYRIVNESDVITGVPSVWMGFHHVGTPVYMDKSGNFVIKPHEIEVLLAPWAGRRFRAHLLEGYEKSFNAICSHFNIPLKCDLPLWMFEENHTHTKNNENKEDSNNEQHKRKLGDSITQQFSQSEIEIRVFKVRRREEQSSALPAKNTNAASSTESSPPPVCSPPRVGGISSPLTLPSIAAFPATNNYGSFGSTRLDSH